MKCSYNIKNLDCANCAKRIEDGLNKDEFIENASVNFATSKVVVTTSVNNPYNYIKKIIEKIEPDAILLEEEQDINTNNYSIIRLVIGTIISIIATLLNNTPLILIGYLILMYNTLKKAYNLLIKAKTINENLLVLISAIGALLLNKKAEGLMVIGLYELGKILEEKAVNKSRKMVSNLLSINEEYANLKQNDKITRVLTKDLKINDIIIIKKGEKIPTDGIVIKGEASLNTSALTGETKKTLVKENDKVLSGSINENGLIEVKVDTLYENSTVSKILNLVENATEKKAKSETIVSKYSKHYTIGVLILAILITILLPILTNATLNESIYKGLTFLVISCPCAIAISVPLSYFSSIGYASSKNILIKGSNYLDALYNVKEIVFDKTGTLTTANLSIQNINIINNNYTKDKILEYAIIGESYSNHPIAKAITNNKEIHNKNIKNYKEISGQGISYELDNNKIKIGNYKFIKYNTTNKELILISINDEVIGSIELGDTIKPNAKKVINKLHNMNIKTRIFSGDNELIAKNVAKKLNIDNIEYEMLPTDKYNKLESIINSKTNKDNKVAFIGDGINDAPVLMLSDVGISMGSIGSDSAIEASDIVIMNDDLDKIVEAINISKKTRLIITENLVFAIATKLIVLILSTIGITSMWQAVFADVGVTIITILNTLRLLKK